MTSARAARPIALPEQRMGPGFSARSVRPQPSVALGPFLSLDEFRMSEPTFPPHPHAGFSAVTYMFAGSPGAFINRDSLGDHRRIGPGALHWTQAGRGMLHEEVPERPGVVSHGMQMFVNLRAKDKLAAPRAFHLDAEEVPVVTSEGATVRVLAGAFGPTRSPLTGLLTEVLLLDVSLAPGATLRVPVDPTFEVFALAIAGRGVLDAQGQPIAAHEVVGYGAGATELSLRTESEPLHLLVGGGAPIHEPVVFGGPFAMTSRAEIEEAFARYRRGEMGTLAPSF